MVAQDGWEQLLAFRDLANKTQTLHEAQVLQLKMWPLLAVPHADAEGARIEINWNTPSVHFALLRKKKAKAPKDLADRLKKLDEAVKAMLGAWWTVQVSLNGVSIYNGPATGKQDSNLVTALRWRDEIVARKERQERDRKDKADAEGKRRVLDRVKE